MLGPSLGLIPLGPPLRRPRSFHTIFVEPNGYSHPPHIRSIKKATTRVTFLVWWRRGESNPRPPVLCHRLYMFIPTFNLTGCYPPDRENRQRFRYLFSASTPNEYPSRFHESDAGKAGRMDTAPVRQQPTGY